MLEPPEPSQEIVEWLSTLRLSQYVSCFQQGGYQALEDCKDLTDDRLLELKVLPTGHRRRILRSLEALGVKQESGEEEDDDGDEEVVEGRRGRRKPVPYPRHVFLKDKKRGTSCQHRQQKEKRECDSEGSQTLPPGAGLGTEAEDLPESRHLRPPQPAPRNPENIQTSMSMQTCMAARSSSSSSSSSSDGESLSPSEIPSDWEISADDPLISSGDSVPVPALTGDQGRFHGEMVENSIYEAQPDFKAGPRLTRSYRLRHRPVPEIPNQTPVGPQDRSAPPAQTTSPEHLTGSEGPIGANGVQKASLQRTLTPIAPYGETFLYNSPESAADPGAKDGPQKGFKDKIKQKKQQRYSMLMSHGSPTPPMYK